MVYRSTIVVRLPSSEFASFHSRYLYDFEP